MTVKFVRMPSDTDPLNVVLRWRHSNDPIDFATYTAKYRIEQDNGTSFLAETDTGVTRHPTQTFTAATTDIITCNDHGVLDGDQLVLSNSGGALPAGLATATRYFVRERTPNTFKLSATPDGSTVDITGTGTGTHSFYVVGSLQLALSGLSALTNYRAWVSVYSGASLLRSLPASEYGIEIEVKAFGN